MDIILLNGPSSAGKSTIARALKANLNGDRECAVIALDDYLPMAADEPIWEDDVFAVMPQMCVDITRALADHKGVIVDHVITSPRVYEALMQAIGHEECLKVLVNCDLETLRQREKLRQDRCIGSAEASLQYLYPKDGYDIRVDSGKESPEQIVKKIMMNSASYMEKA